jgi:hypothetical protein
MVHGRSNSASRTQPFSKRRHYRSIYADRRRVSKTIPLMFSSGSAESPVCAATSTAIIQKTKKPADIVPEEILPSL